jgi:hypothetical protein
MALPYPCAANEGFASSFANLGFEGNAGFSLGLNDEYQAYEPAANAGVWESTSRHTFVMQLANIIDYTFPCPQFFDLDGFFAGNTGFFGNGGVSWACNELPHVSRSISPPPPAPSLNLWLVSQASLPTLAFGTARLERPSSLPMYAVAAACSPQLGCLSSDLSTEHALLPQEGFLANSNFFEVCEVGGVFMAHSLCTCLCIHCAKIKVSWRPQLIVFA